MLTRPLSLPAAEPRRVGHRLGQVEPHVQPRLVAGLAECGRRCVLLRHGRARSARQLCSTRARAYPGALAPAPLATPRPHFPESLSRNSPSRSPTSSASSRRGSVPSSTARRRSSARRRRRTSAQSSSGPLHGSGTRSTTASSECCCSRRIVCMPCNVEKLFLPQRKRVVAVIGERKLSMERLALWGSRSTSALDASSWPRDSLDCSHSAAPRRPWLASPPASPERRSSLLLVASPRSSSAAPPRPRLWAAPAPAQPTRTSRTSAAPP